MRVINREPATISNPPTPLRRLSFSLCQRHGERPCTKHVLDRKSTISLAFGGHLDYDYLVKEQKIAMRVTGREGKAVAKLAKLSGLNMSNYLRQLLGMGVWRVAEHGTPSMYGSYQRCRCPVCVSAMELARKKRIVKSLGVEAA